MKLAVFALAAVAVLAQDDIDKQAQKALNQYSKSCQLISKELNALVGPNKFKYSLQNTLLK